MTAGALTTADLDVLALVATLRLAPPDALVGLAGLGGRTRTRARLRQLRAAGLLGAVRLPLRPGSAPELLHLADPGAAALARARGEYPAALVRRARVGGPALRALALRLPVHLGCCALLARLAGARPGTPRLRAWEQPWRRRFPRRHGDGIGVAALPTGVELAWPDEETAYVLVPDDPAVPPSVHRPALVGLARRRLIGLPVPTLVVSVAGEWRATAWLDLLAAVATATGDAPLPALIVVAGDPPAALEPCRVARRRAAPPAPPPETRVPALIGAPFDRWARPSGARDRLALRALGLAPADRRLLDLIGPHPYLPPDKLAVAAARTERWTRQRLSGLLRSGAVRLADEPCPRGEEQPVLTRDGLVVAAAWHGLTADQAVRHLGYVAHDPPAPGRAQGRADKQREALERTRQHTQETDAVFVTILETLAERRKAGRDAALTDWHNAARCARGHVRPDGYGLVRLDGRFHGFLLELDRGTMKPLQLAAKFARYYRYRDEGAYDRDYDGFPTVLVATTKPKKLATLGRLLCALAEGRQPLPVLLTTTALAAADPERYLGPVWLAPADAAVGRTAAGRRPFPSAETMGAEAPPNRAASNVGPGRTSDRGAR